jgi:hypothetical protein
MKPTIINTAEVKNYNTRIIKNALKALPSGTKNTISKITGLSVATCNTILNELDTSGEILEVEIESSCSVGRPAKAYKFNENYSYVFCIYLIYENNKKILNYAIVNLLGTVIEEKSTEKEIIDYSEIENLIEKLIAKYPNIQGIGIGIPGVVTKSNIIDFCDIEELAGCPLAELLINKFGKSVVIENDMNLTAYGFYETGEYEENTSIAVVAFFKDNWPGSGIIVDGHIIHGSTNFAGEVSYLPFGCTHEEQKRILSYREGIIPIVSKTICSLSAVINPKTIILTGTLLTDSLLSEILASVSEIIPERHIPEITLQNNINKYYLYGLSSMTLKALND